ncbi:MAG TPA: HRDC domain-containing protein [Steroidobacteraceae bacterium]|nr:HRDC domain-containing protein [Steroidobacteraceae bacterium]
MPGIISEPQAFAQLCVTLTGQRELGLDTEFMRERTYFAQLCLLQLSWSSEAVCIDTLALTDLSELRPVMRSSATRKIVHAARQDLEVLWPVSGGLDGVFDTQIAAALAGLPAQIGYADLTQTLLGRSLHKSQTRTDWSRRPLSAAQVDYALDDVRYLPELAARLQQRLMQLGRWSWFEEEMVELNGGQSFQIDPQQAWRRLKGFGDLDEARRSLARALAAWREQRAIDADRPRNWILPDPVLRDIVGSVPRTTQQLAAIAELPEGVLRHSGAEILALIDSLALPARLPPLVSRRRPDPAETETVRRLAQLTRETGRELGIAPEVLATRRDMERLVSGERDAGPLSGWRRAVIGERLLQAL